MTKVEAEDTVQVDGISGISGNSKGESTVRIDSLANVNVDGATLESLGGDVQLSARSEAINVADANLFVASGLSGSAFANANAITNVENRIDVHNSSIKGSNVNLFAGKGGALLSPNFLFSLAAANITTVSLFPSISVPKLKAEIDETNFVNVTGTTQLEAFRDVNLVALSDPAKLTLTQGSVISLSLIPFGMDVPDGRVSNTVSKVTIDPTTTIKAGSTNKVSILLKAFDFNGIQRLDGIDASLLGTELTSAHKIAFDLPSDLENVPYEFGEVGVDNIDLTIARGTIVKVIAGANAGGVAGNYYRYLAVTDDDLDSVVLQNENYSDTNRWENLGADLTEGDLDLEEIDGNPNYDSDITLQLGLALQEKFYVVKPVNLGDVRLSYANVGLLLIEEYRKILGWIANHEGEDEALARYDVQLGLVKDALDELGLLVTEITEEGVETSINSALDTIFLELPEIEASPGSVFIESPNSSSSEFENLVGAQIQAGAGARINIVNELPFSMIVDDTFIRDNERVIVDANGDLQFLSPGNVYLNNSAILPPGVTAQDIEALNLENKTINILQDALGDVSDYDTSGFDDVDFETLVGLDQDLFIQGDIINESGTVSIENVEGSISVSGEIRGASVNIVSARDFTLNAEDWLHTNRDPRQYINYNRLRSIVYNQASPSFPFTTFERQSAADVVAKPATLVKDVTSDVDPNDGFFFFRLFFAPVYRYIGTEPANLFLHNIDYSNDANWQQTGGNFFSSKPGKGKFLSNIGEFSNTRIRVNPVQTLQDAINEEAVGVRTPDDLNGGSDPTAPSKIVAQGRIAITARFLNINGLVQSGTDTIAMEIAADFVAPTETTSFRDSNGEFLTGISFGADGIPIDGYWDAQQQAFVLEELVPQGGEIIIAGQILSTGNAQLKVASGFTGVSIDNDSPFDLIVNRIDTTKDRVGKITIIDTSRLEKAVYEQSSNLIIETHFDGVKVAPDLASGEYVDGEIPLIVYTEDPERPPIQHAIGDIISYLPEAGLRYIWTEGQEKTEIERRVYQKRSFSFFPGFEVDFLVSDRGWNYRTFVDRDGDFLLESESLENDFNPSGVPDYATGDDYTLALERKDDITVDLTAGTSFVKDVSTDLVYRYKGANDADLFLGDIDYAGSSDWEESTEVSFNKSRPALGQYLSNFTNFRISKFGPYVSGGGWLKKITVTTIVQLETGIKDFFTHTLKADHPIDIVFTTGAADPDINIESLGDILIQGHLTAPDSGNVNLTSGGSISQAEGLGIFSPATNLNAGVVFNSQGTVVEVNSDATLVLDVVGNTGIPVNALSAGDIIINVFSEDNLNNSVVIGEVTSLNGNVTVNARHGITMADSTSFIQGERVELRADEGTIGTASQAIRINSNVDGFGGVAARAQGDINITEISGDLNLLEPEAIPDAMASVQSLMGDIRLETLSGSIFDNFVELFNPGSTIDADNLDSFRQEFISEEGFSLDAFKYPVSPGLYSVLFPNADFLGQTQVVSATETLNIVGANITLVAGGSEAQIGRVGDMATIVFKNDSPGEPFNYSALSTQEKELLSTATANDIVGVNYELFRYTGAADLVDVELTHVEVNPGVTLVKDQNTGTVYRYVGATPDQILLRSVDYANDVNWVDASDISHPSWVDTSNINAIQNLTLVSHEGVVFKYIGANAEFFLSEADYTDISLWEATLDDPNTFEQNPDENRYSSNFTSIDVAVFVQDVDNNRFVSDYLNQERFSDTSLWQKIATDFSTSADSVVSINNGNTVLVQFDADVYGVYEFLGNSGLINLANQDYNDGSRWQKLVADHATDDNVVSNILMDDLVLNKFVVESLTLEQSDDVDFEATSSLTVDAFDGVSLDTPADVKIKHIIAGGDVRLESLGNITDLYETGSLAAVSSFGSLTLGASGFVQGDDGINPFRIQLSPSSALRVIAGDVVDIVQIADDAIINGISQEISDLFVARVDAGGSATIEVIEGTMTVGRVSSDVSVDLRAEASILDAFDDSGAPIVNVFTGNVASPATGDVFLSAGGNIGIASNFLDIEVRVGDLDAFAGGNVFIHSSRTLNIRELEATSGDVGLDVEGDALIDQITALAGTVAVRADDSIVDRRSDSASNIDAKSIALNAEAGTIGTPNPNPFEINSSHLLDGRVTAEAFGSIVLIENDGDMLINTIVSETDDVTLETLNGSILDGNELFDLGIEGLTLADFNIAAPLDPVDLNIAAININLTAQNGSIGTSGDAIEVDSSTPSKGWLNAAATNDAYLTEVSGELNVGLISSDQGDVGLNVRDSAATGEDLLMDLNARIFAPLGSIFLNAGDNAIFDLGSQLVSANEIILHSGTGDTGNNDAVGTLIDIRSSLDSTAIEIAGEREDDLIILHPVSVTGYTRVLGDTDGLPGGRDTIILDQLPSITNFHDRPGDGIGIVRDSVDLDGRGGYDTYIINTTGGLTDYRVNVLDTGLADDGADTLTINGTEDSDIFLLRRITEIPGQVSETPAFVTLVKGTLDEVLTNSPTRPTAQERINYDENINGRLIVNSLGGDDYFASDDNSTITTLDGGSGNDTFQIGQLYKTERVASDVAPEDAFDTIETTRGFLSHGVTFSTTIYGGSGDDQFSVYSNKAQLHLEGNDGNDTFEVRAFALVADDSFSTEEGTEIDSGFGEDLIQYNINSSVAINGGDGFDTVVVVGTEFNDNFVITEDGVFGAGFAVRFDSIEAVQVDGVEGDDDFFVLSTASDVMTTVVGGLGSDTVNVGGDVTQTIASRELEGFSGIINHSIGSAVDASYDQLLAPGIDLNIGTLDQGQVLIIESDKKTVVRELGAGTIDDYIVRLTRAPIENVYVTVSAARSASEDEDQGGSSIQVSSDGSTFEEAVVLTFTSANWMVDQTVSVQAIDDSLVEGERIYIVSHAMKSDDPAFSGANNQEAVIRDVEVTVIDSDQPALIFEQTNGETQVLEGNLVAPGDITGISDSYTMQLSQPPVAGETVTVSLSFDNTQFILTNPSADTRFDIVAGTITFDDSNWDVPVEIGIEAVDDSTRENTQHLAITHNVTSTDASFVVDGSPEIKVVVVDNDTAGLLVTETDSSTLLFKGDAMNPSVSDFYDVRLTSAPIGEVVVSILTDGQTLISSDDLRFFDDPTDSLPPTVTFTASNWFDAVTLEVAVDPSFVPPTEFTKTFSSQPHTLAEIAGPLFIEGFFLEGANRSLINPLMLPGESNILAADGDVQDFTGTGEAGTIDTMTVLTAELEAARIRLGLATIDELVGRTLEIATGPGQGRFWQINAVAEEAATGTSVLTLQNVTLFGSTGSENTVVPTSESSFAITNLSETLFADENLQVDRANIFNDGSLSDDTGVLGAVTVDNDLISLAAPINLSGLGLGGDLFTDAGTPDTSDDITLPGGITVDDLEVLEILLGSGNDMMTINDTLRNIAAVGGLTLVHGGGNTDIAPGVRGGDTIIVNGGGGSDSPLAVFGDTSQDGRRYSGQSGVSEQDSEGSPLAIQFDNFGNDIIDASVSSLGVTIYGGLGDDILTGSQGGDHIAGGSGDDIIFGQDGGDHIYGDDGFNIDLSVRLDLSVHPLIVATAPSTSDSPTSDALDAGSDEIHGEGGNDFILGDHGVIDQAEGISRITSTLDVVGVRTVRPEDGASDVITGDDGNDVIFAGSAGDFINFLADGTQGLGESGDDLIVADNGEAQFVLLADRSSRLVEIETNAPEHGGDDLVFTGVGRKILFGGTGSDTLLAGGDVDRDFVVGDEGLAIFSASTGNVLHVSTKTPEAGDRDIITAGDGPNVLVGGSGGDDITAGNAATLDIIIGDNGFADFDDSTTGFSILREIRTSDPLYGERDIIFAGEGPDVVLGGSGGDFIDAGTDGSRDIVIGDNGEAFFNPEGVLLEIRTTAPGLGGKDDIRTGDGFDVVMGGDNDDFILASGANGFDEALALVIAGQFDDLDPGDSARDIVLGDDGEAFFTNEGDLVEILTINPDNGGDDIIITGNGPDVVFGGSGNDIIVAGGTDDVEDIVFGDNARATFQGTETFDPGEEFSILSFNFQQHAQSVGSDRPGWGCSRPGNGPESR